MINLEQIRARRAFAKAAEVGDSDAKEYLSLARNLPAMFQSNGLLATWAFMLSKQDKKHFKILLKALVEHFQDEQFNLVAGNTNETKVFTEKWTGKSPVTGPQLMQLTAEAIAFSGWLKRAAEALCDK